MEKLKKCPFCGGEAEIYEQKHREYPSAFYVFCTVCGIRQRDRNDEERAIKEWNRRCCD